MLNSSRVVQGFFCLANRMKFWSWCDLVIWLFPALATGLNTRWPREPIGWSKVSSISSVSSIHMLCLIEILIDHPLVHAKTKVISESTFASVSKPRLVSNPLIWKWVWFRPRFETERERERDSVHLSTLARKPREKSISVANLIVLDLIRKKTNQFLPYNVAHVALAFFRFLHLWLSAAAQKSQPWSQRFTFLFLLSEIKP